MRTRILSACVAIAFAAGCQRQPPPSLSAPLPPKAEPAPLAVAPTVAAPAPAAEAAPEPPGVDPLAVAHGHRRGDDHLANAAQLRADGDLEAALTEAERAIDDDPADTEALAEVGKLAALTSRPEQGALAYARLAEVLPEDPQPLVQQARLLLDAKDFEGAGAAAEQALSRDPHSADAFHVLGRARLSAGRLDEAVAAFEQVIALEPDHGHALNNLGFALLRANRDAEALEVLRRAALLLPQVAHVQNNLGVALERTGDTAGAREAFALATSLSPKYVKAAVNAARMSRLASAAGEVEVGEPAMVEPMPVSSGR